MTDFRKLFKPVDGNAREREPQVHQADFPSPATSSTPYGRKEGMTIDTNPTVQEVRSTYVTLYTCHTRITGYLHSSHSRPTDMLNTLDQDFVVVHEAIAQALQATTAEGMQAASMLVRKDNIMIAIPRDRRIGAEQAPARQGLKVERIPVKATVEAWPFSIEGDLHLAPGVAVLQHVRDPHHAFMAVTDARVSYHPSPLLGFQAPFVVVNRRNVQLVVEASEIGQQTQLDPDVVEPETANTEISGIRAAELLAATEVFKQVPLTELQRISTQLCESGRACRILYKAGSEVFHQGDAGDTLYVIESGHLEVTLRDTHRGGEKRLAYLGPGDFFGEMAVLGERRRTATVRAVTDVSLLALQEQAMTTLLQEFPSATSTMLGIMVERQSELAGSGLNMAA